MPYRYQIEKLADHLEEAAKFTPQGWAENGFPGIAVEPEWGRYVAGEKQGALICMSARDDAGTFLGALGMWIFRSLSVRSMIMARSSAYWVRPGFDRPIIMRELLEHMMVECKKRGCTHISIYDHPWRPGKKLYERMGFRPVETLYMLDL